jgi:hypothetical protein
VRLLAALSRTVRQPPFKPEGCEVAEPTILLHWDATGAFHWAATPGVRVICVDEQAPDDRVYEGTAGASHEMIRTVANGDCKDPIDAANRFGGA